MPSLRVSCTKCGAPLEPGRLMCTCCGVLQEFIPEPEAFVGTKDSPAATSKHSLAGTQSPSGGVENMPSLRVSCTKCGAPLEPGRLMCTYCGVLQEFIPEPEAFVGTKDSPAATSKHSYRGLSFEHWLASLESNDPRVSARAIVALRAIGGPVYSLPFLVGTRIFGIIPAARQWHGKDASVVPTLTGWIAEGGLEVFDALARLDGLDVSAALIKLLQQPINSASPTLHLRTIGALAGRHHPDGVLARVFVEALLVAASARCLAVQRNLCIALRSLDDLNAVPALIRVAGEQAAPVSVWALNTLAVLDDPSASALATDVLARYNSTSDERRAACLGLGRFGERSSAEVLSRRLADADAAVARVAAWALGQLESSPAIPALQAVRDNNPSLFAQACDALYRIDAKHQPTVAAAQAQLREQAQRGDVSMRGIREHLGGFGIAAVSFLGLLISGSSEMAVLGGVGLTILALIVAGSQALAAPSRRLAKIEASGGMNVLGFTELLKDPDLPASGPVAPTHSGPSTASFARAFGNDGSSRQAWGPGSRAPLVVGAMVLLVAIFLIAVVSQNGPSPGPQIVRQDPPAPPRILRFSGPNYSVGGRTSYGVRVYGCDDSCGVNVNGTSIVRVAFGKDSGVVDITNMVRWGAGVPTDVRMVVTNDGGAAAFTMELWGDGKVIARQSCGVAFQEGCEGNREFPRGLAAEWDLLLRRGGPAAVLRASVEPAVIVMPPGTKQQVVWHFSESGGLPVHITSRTAHFETGDGRIVGGTIGPHGTDVRVTASSEASWTDDVYVPSEVAEQASARGNGMLLLLQSFSGVDGRGNPAGAEAVLRITFEDRQQPQRDRTRAPRPRWNFQDAYRENSRYIERAWCREQRRLGYLSEDGTPVVDRGPSFWGPQPDCRAYLRAH